MIDSMGPALEMAAHIHIQTARRTGRTSALLNSVKEGDRIITPTDQCRRFIEREVRDRQLKGVEVHSVTASLDGLHREVIRRRGGTYHFDHTWFELFYGAELKRLRGQSSELIRAMDERNPQKAIVEDVRFWGPWL